MSDGFQNKQKIVLLGSGGSQDTLFAIEMEAFEIFMRVFHRCLNTMLALSNPEYGPE